MKSWSYFGLCSLQSICSITISIIYRVWKAAEAKLFILLTMFNFIVENQYGNLLQV